MKKILKTLAFVLVSVLALTAFASCEKKHEHNYKYESDNTKHRQVCEDCDDKTDWEAHVWGDWTVTVAATEDKKGSRTHTCTVCGKEVAEDIKQLDPELAVNTAAMAVYAQVPADWETVNIYYWNGLEGDANTLDPGYKVGWPGVPMTLVSEKDHLWGYEIPVGVEQVIFNDGAGTQTVDIKLAKAKNLYVLGAEANSEGKFEITYSSYDKKATDPELAKPVLKEAGYVVTYVTVEGWEDVNVYWFGSAQETAWPGVAMEAVDGATNVYTFAKLPDDASHVIFNNGAGTQTVNIPVAKGLNGYIIQEDTVQEGDDTGKHLAKNGEFNLGTKVIDEVTLVDFYAQVPADWEEVYIHFWEGAAGLKPEWPGAKMTLVDAEKHIWKYALDSRVATIIIDAGKDTETVDLPQTPNTLINVDGVNAVIVTAADTDSGAAAALANYKDGTMTEVVVEKKTPVYYVVGEVKALSATWNFADDGKLVINDDETEAALTLALAENDSFKVAVEGWSAEFGYTAELGAAFTDAGGNIKVVTAGTYEFKVTDLNGTPALTITLKP